jgi:hypothetical protein
MGSVERQAHWENVYTTKGENEVSWFEDSPTASLDLIRSTGVSTSASIIDIGGGASRLVEALVNEGFAAVSVLDLSKKSPCDRKDPARLAWGKSAMGRGGRDVLGTIRDL